MKEIRVAVEDQWIKAPVIATHRGFLRALQPGLRLLLSPALQFFRMLHRVNWDPAKHPSCRAITVFSQRWSAFEPTFVPGKLPPLILWHHSEMRTDP